MSVNLLKYVTIDDDDDDDDCAMMKLKNLIIYRQMTHTTEYHQHLHFASVK